MTPRAWDELRGYMSEMTEDLIAWAVQEACEHGGNNWAYVSKVLSGLSAAGVKTVEAAEKRSADYKAKKADRKQGGTGSGKQIAQLDYAQREYEERKPGELPDWLRDMMDEEATA